MSKNILLDGTNGRTSASRSYLSSEIVGYGDSAVQLAANTDAVTLNTPCGRVTSFTAIAAGGETFTLHNSYIRANSVVLCMCCNTRCTTTSVLPTVVVSNIANGSCDIDIASDGTNPTSTSTIVQFLVL